MTPPVPRNGQFSYLTETFMRSQHDGPLGHLKSEVKIESVFLDKNGIKSFIVFVKTSQKLLTVAIFQKWQDSSVALWI